MSAKRRHAQQDAKDENEEEKRAPTQAAREPAAGGVKREAT